MTDLHCPTCGSRVFSTHPAVSGGGEVTNTCPDSFHVDPTLPTIENKAEFINKLLGEGLVYISPGEVSDEFHDLYGIQPVAGGHMAVIRKNEPEEEKGDFIPGIQEINDAQDSLREGTEKLQEWKNENDPPVAEENRSGWVDAIGEEVTQNDEDANPEQHIGQPVDYDLGEEEAKPKADELYANEIYEAKPQNRTSDGRFSS